MALGATDPERAQALTPLQALQAVHAGRDATWRLERVHGRSPMPYLWVADRRSTPPAERLAIAALWWHRATLEAHRAPSSGYPSWFIPWAACISIHEEYGFYGPNTSAGRFGMIYPPDAYPGGAGMGGSWLALDLQQQLRIVYAERMAYGTSPWSTAIYC